MVTLSVNLSDDLAERLQRMAREARSTPEDLILAALRERLAEEDALAAAIARGEADIAAGRVVPHEEVMRELREWAAGLRARRTAR
ncbi:MAG TPA: ribbon-helix-helix protein, CopG family [Crenalkalicoccus sp.]|jgi:predicted transcriptional regulator|nr:ribbon-helix-helix protein, CopG family [Crenalkalicoccus sp.]